MLNVGRVNVPVCHGVTRRSFLQAGSAGLAGLTLPALMKLQA
ncbi:MAG: twin-arginine translocation signal domain-containing protein, partial [Planctomycetia bacterium]|nr:twin-arginine translocation signal domain-containing protein [Planctomycetia bacterium]